MFAKENFLVGVQFLLSPCPHFGGLALCALCRWEDSVAQVLLLSSKEFLVKGHLAKLVKAVEKACPGGSLSWYVIESKRGAWH
jgi:hypothetical protein